jgi:heat shock protein HslJ
VAGRFWAAITVVGLLVSGCASKTRGEDPVVVAQGLAGAWKVDAADLVPDTVLTLSTKLEWDTPCGKWFGSWRADEAGAFAGMLEGWEGDDCQPPHDGDPTPGWLRQASSYRVDGPAAELLDVDGQVVARLSAEAAPSSKPSVDPVRAGLRASEPLPSGLVAADRETLIGRWSPVGSEGSDRPQPPFLEIATDGSWSASDGCNGSAGRWSLGEQGSLVAVSGPATDIGCNNIETGGAFAGATRIGFDGAELVMLDATAKELLRMKRDG